MAKSPVSILFTTDGIEVGVKDALALPTDARGFISVGFDGTNTRFIRCTTGGALHVSDAGGSLTVDTTQLPAILVGGRLDTNIGSWFGSVLPTVGQKVSASSIPVTMASNQTPFPIQNTGNPQLILNNIVLTGSGSAVLSVDLDDAELVLVYQVAGPVTGTTPTLVFSVTDLQPTTLVATTNVTTGPTLTAITTPATFSHVTRTGKVRVDWTVTGTTPSFGGTTVTVVPLIESSVALIGKAVPPTGKAIAGRDPAGLLQSVALTTEQSVQMSPAPNRQPVHSNSTITVSGSSILDDTWGAKEVSLFINIKAAPTGTTPTITYTMQEVDPGDNTTVLGTSVTGAALTAIGTQILTLPITKSGIVKVSWVVTGTTPSFTQVFSTLTSKIAGSAILYDTTGSPLGTPTNPIATQPAVSAAAQIGLVTGLLILGGGTAGTLNAIRATTYTEPSTNAQRSFSSSSASDTAAGVGARQVTLIYYNSTGAGPFTEVVTLNGVAAVNTVSSTICFIETMIVTSVGTTSTNVGTITLFAATAGGGGAVGTIGVGNLVAATGDSRTLWAHHYVATGKIASLATVILSNFGGTGSGITTMLLKSKILGVANAAEVIVSDLIAVPTGNALVRQLGIPIRVTGPARILGYAIPASNNTTSELSFDFSEV